MSLLLSAGTGGDSTGAADPAAPVVGVDTGSRTLRAADAAVAAVVALLRERSALHEAVVATHLTRLGALPHVTLSVRAPALDAGALGRLVTEALPDAVTWSAPDGDDARAPGDAPAPGHCPPSAAAAAEGARAHAAGSSGRAVHFPGVEDLVGAVTVAELLSRTAIDEVRVMGASEPAAGGLTLHTRGHVRPDHQQGHLVLTTEWAAGRLLVPFETPTPTPCCADHA